MMDESIKISVAYEFREYKIDKRDNKRIRFLSFSSIHGDLKIELPYGSIITKEYEWRRKGDRKYQEPDMKEILQHCMKMAEDGNDLIEDTFKDIIENIDDEMEIMIDGIPKEWEEIKEMLLDETIDELEY
jgi:hypothetical protein